MTNNNSQQSGDVIDASGTARTGETVSTNNITSEIDKYGGNHGSHGGLGGTEMYNRGLLRNNMFRGSGINNTIRTHDNNFRGTIGGPYRDQDLNIPFCAPSSPPGFLISLMRVMRRVVIFIGRVAILIDQKTQAIQNSMPAFLQMVDLPGLIYPELVRFVFHLLCFRRKHIQNQPTRPSLPCDSQNNIKKLEAASTGAWDCIWENYTNK